MLPSRIQRSAQNSVLWHYFRQPVPYMQGLQLQEALVSRRIAAKTALQEHEDGSTRLEDANIKKHTAIAKQDVLLLLQHRPVYTTGRRETDPEILKVEKERLTALGADYIATQRGGQTTYHGPGQLVGYPIFDTAAMDVSRAALRHMPLSNACTQLSTRCYVQRISDFLERLLIDKLDVPLLLPPPHVGAYPSATSKVGSIGIQIRKRITSHGFSLNVTDDVRYWFDQIIACGDASIKATSIEKELEKLGRPAKPRLEVDIVVPLAIQQLAQVFKRDFEPLQTSNEEELKAIIANFGAGFGDATKLVS